MNSTHALCHELGTPTLLGMGPIVFVVDDDISVRESLELLIRCEGWQPETFASAQEFLTRPRALVPSCLVLDFSLPGLTGLELQKRIAVERTDMPIIFITGYADVPTTVKAMKAGAVEFLIKPFSDDVLLSAIRAAIERSRTRFESGGGDASASGPLRVSFLSRTTGYGTGGLWPVEQTSWWGARHQRDHSEGAPRQGHAKDAGRFSCGPGENGREAPARTSSDDCGLTAIFTVVIIREDGEFADAVRPKAEESVMAVVNA